MIIDPNAICMSNIFHYSIPFYVQLLHAGQTSTPGWAGSASRGEPKKLNTFFFDLP